METFSYFIHDINFFLFKSYYVVWKPEITANPNVGIQGLNRTMQYGNLRDTKFMNFGSPKFKSYYVVWKPPREKIILNTKKSLNRTMQYGNEDDYYDSEVVYSV